MFCPRCGLKAVEESHKFCKACGANLQSISDAMSSPDDPIQRLKSDAGRLKDSLVESGITFGNALKNEANKLKSEARKGKWQGRDKWGSWSRSHDSPKDTEPDLANKSPLATNSYGRRNSTPKPREWLRYSWQHNLRAGLMSLLGGLAQGGVLYYLFHVAISAGTIEDLEGRAHIHGLQAIAEIIWLLAAIPVMKGIGQIIYAAFFAESIKTLSDRYAPQYIVQPPATIERPRPDSGQNAMPSAPPPSVTEQTTNILEKSEPRIAREA
jgi:hypothetical protein